jgi:hypothetical protein
MAGVRITQLDPNALPGRRYGSFAGKPAGAVAVVLRRWLLLLGVGR